MKDVNREGGWGGNGGGRKGGGGEEEGRKEGRRKEGGREGGRQGGPGGYTRHQHGAHGRGCWGDNRGGGRGATGRLRRRHDSPLRSGAKPAGEAPLSVLVGLKAGFETSATVLAPSMVDGARAGPCGVDALSYVLRSVVNLPWKRGRSTGGERGGRECQSVSRIRLRIRGHAGGVNGVGGVPAPVADQRRGRASGVLAVPCRASGTSRWDWTLWSDHL